jgi:hypothetical protein
MRHPVSSLALGPFGWTQTAVFLVAGLLTVAFAAGFVRLPGVRRKVGAILIGVWGAGLAGAGAFVTDPVSGYPPGTPALPEPLTMSGALHDLFSVPAFFALGAACFVLSAGAAGVGRSSRCSVARQSSAPSCSRALDSNRPNHSSTSPGCGNESP